MISVSFNTAKFSKDMVEFGVLTGLTDSQVVTRTSRLWCRDCILSTPPTGKGAAAKSSDAQYRLGKSRISRDIKSRGFPALTKLDMARRDDRVANTIGRLAAAGRYRELTLMLRNFGLEVAQVLAGPERSLHQGMRDGRTGRVRSNSVPFWVTSENRQEAYFQSVLAKLGTAKGGWSTAASKLRLKLPKWAQGKGSPGHFRGITDKQRPSIEFGNRTGFLQSGFYEAKIMKTTARFRESAMKKELERYWRAASTNSLTQLRARFGRPRIDVFEALE